MPAVVAGADYKIKRLDVAAVEGKRLLGAKRYDLGGDVANVVAVIGEAVQLMKSVGATELWLERPWFRGAGKDGQHAVSNASTLELHKVATRVETLAVLVGLKVHYVAVASWHATMLGNGRLRSDEAKDASIAFVKGAYGWATSDDNEADAICLAAYGEAFSRFRGLVPQ